MKKKKQVPMPKLSSQKSRIVWKWWIASAIGLGVIFGVSLWARTQKTEQPQQVEYIQKGVVTNYVCKIVGAEPDQDVIAVQCFTK